MFSTDQIWKNSRHQYFTQCFFIDMSPKPPSTKVLKHKEGNGTAIDPRPPPCDSSDVHEIIRIESHKKTCTSVSHRSYRLDFVTMTLVFYTIQFSCHTAALLHVLGSAVKLAIIDNQRPVRLLKQSFLTNIWLHCDFWIVINGCSWVRFRHYNCFRNRPCFGLK